MEQYHPSGFKNVLCSIEERIMPYSLFIDENTELCWDSWLINNWLTDYWPDVISAVVPDGYYFGTRLQDDDKVFGIWKRDEPQADATPPCFTCGDAAPWDPRYYCLQCEKERRTERVGIKLEEE